MFSSSAKKKLEEKVADLTKKLDHANSYIKQQEDESRKRARECSVALDFVTMQAFSVERMYRGMNDEVTNIGYIRRDGEASEWVLCCNSETHEKVVTWFKQYLESKPT